MEKPFNHRVEGLYKIVQKRMAAIQFTNRLLKKGGQSGRETLDTPIPPRNPYRTAAK